MTVVSRVDLEASQRRKSNLPSFFRRTESERTSATLPLGNSSARSNATMSEDEASSKGEKKKKKKGLFSFMKKKDKSTSS
ncbi:hypothetical protein Aduo_019313 [Ancylostoma duodenale]